MSSSTRRSRSTPSASPIRSVMPGSYAGLRFSPILLSTGPHFSFWMVLWHSLCEQADVLQ